MHSIVQVFNGYIFRLLEKSYQWKG